MFFAEQKRFSTHLTNRTGHLKQIVQLTVFICHPAPASPASQPPYIQRYYYAPSHHDNQRRIGVSNLLYMHQQDLSSNANIIQPSPLFQNTHTNSRTAHGDGRAVRSTQPFRGTSVPWKSSSPSSASSCQRSTS